MDELNDIFREISQRIKIILAKTDVLDPYEKNEDFTSLPSLPISAVVNDLGFGKIRWNMDGISSNDAKELIVEKKNKNLLEQCYKIQIDGIDYEGYKVLGKMQIKTEGEYCRIYCYRKQA